MNTLLKVLCTLLNNKLITYCNNQQLINQEQIGFQKNNRRSDHILTLKAVLNKYVGDKKGKKVYICFVDFQKAFDSVWHDGLFRKLENKCINGNFLKLIKSIYNNTKCAVIFEVLKNTSLLTLNGQQYLNALMYADDLIIMSTTQEGLQKSLNTLNDYCQKWKLNVNHKQTKCMIFSKASNIKNIYFTINSKIIDITKEFEYLGITINSKSCTFTPTLSDLTSKANKAIYSLLSKLPIKLTPVKTMLKLFDCCIAPILLYGSEVWAHFMNLDWK